MNVGDVLVNVNLKAIKDAGLNPIMIVAVTNFSDLEKEMNIQTGLTKAANIVAKLS